MGIDQGCPYLDAGASEVIPSPRAIALIEQFETGGVFPSRISWPGGASGLTLGCGYDLGYQPVDQIGADWHALPSDIVVRLQSYAGRTGSSAQFALFGTHDIRIPEAIGRAVFENLDVPRWSAATAAAFHGCERLSGDSFGALVSLCFNRGTSMSDTQPGNRSEMRRIRDACAAGDFGAVPDLIRSMKRLWVGKGLDGLLARRDAEAALFQEGLVAQGAPATKTEIPLVLSTDDLNDREAVRLGL